MSRKITFFDPLKEQKVSKTHEVAGEKAFGLYDVLDRKQSSLRINGQLLFSAV